MQRIIATIGVPRSGKSTFASKFDPNEFITATFDDFRQTLWPPHRRIYWKVREGKNGAAAQKILHATKYAAITSALENGFSVLSPDTHVKYEYALPLKEIAEIFGIKIEWVVLDVPYEILEQRNKASDESLGHRVPDEVLAEFYNRMWADDAWWRREPNVEIIKYKG